ncbi:hypothetical protein, partial [Streptomyces hainanensis]
MWVRVPHGLRAERGPGAGWPAARSTRRPPGLLERSGGHHTADTLAEALTEAVPGVAATVFHALGMAAKDRD